MGSQPVKVLTIGGSDSGGAAGIQADLKTWTALGVYGMSAIAAVTAQNSESVAAVRYLEPEFIGAQIEAVLSDYGAQALKTGFLGRVDIIEAVAGHIRANGAGPVVVDPVLVNHRGTSMFGPDVIAAYNHRLLPLAELVTPNWREAYLLTGVEESMPPRETELLAICEALCAAGARQALVTGIPSEEHITNYWFDGSDLTPYSQPRLETNNRHGSGDTLSAAICANLALGRDMGTAVQKAQHFTTRALAASAGWHMGRGHGPLSHFIEAESES
jgi:hydroxymethylpyrimidine/phosphomethylpyrimidine kinase